jgi:hypothetical protein
VNRKSIGVVSICHCARELSYLLNILGHVENMSTSNEFLEKEINRYTDQEGLGGTFCGISLIDAYLVDPKKSGIPTSGSPLSGSQFSQSEIKRPCDR